MRKKEKDNKTNKKTEITENGETSADSSEVVSANTAPDDVIQPPAKKKYGWLGTVFLVLICGVSIIIMLELSRNFNDGEIKSFGELIKNADWRYGALALAVVLLMIILDAFKYSIITRVTQNRANFLNSFKVSLLGKYYDNITPFSTGGQPMQIYYLHKKGYSGGTASAIVLIKYFAQMFAWLTVSLVLMAAFPYFLNTLDPTTQKTLTIFGWIGWAGNAILPLIIVMFAIFPKFATKFAGGIVSFGHKLKIVKDKDKVMLKAYKVVDDFKTSFKIMSKKPLQFIVLVLVCFVEPIVMLAFPYFILMFLAGSNVTPGWETVLQVMTLHIYAMYAAAIFPTPGNSGFVETTFTLAFSSIASAALFWVVFLWRFSMFYIYIVIGVGISIFELIRKAVRTSRAKKAEAAEVKDENTSENKKE